MRSFSKPQNKAVEKMFLKATATFVPHRIFVEVATPKINFREILGKVQSAKINSRKMPEKEIGENWFPQIFLPPRHVPISED